MNAYGKKTLRNRKERFEEHTKLHNLLGDERILSKDTLDAVKIVQSFLIRQIKEFSQHTFEDTLDDENPTIFAFDIVKPLYDFNKAIFIECFRIALENKMEKNKENGIIEMTKALKVVFKFEPFNILVDGYAVIYRLICEKVKLKRESCTGPEIIDPEIIDQLDCGKLQEDQEDSKNIIKAIKEFAEREIEMAFISLLEDKLAKGSAEISKDIVRMIFVYKESMFKECLEKVLTKAINDRNQTNDDIFERALKIVSKFVSPEICLAGYEVIYQKIHQSECNKGGMLKVLSEHIKELKEIKQKLPDGTFITMQLQPSLKDQVEALLKSCKE